MPQIVKKISTYIIITLLSIYMVIWLVSPYIFSSILKPILEPYKLTLDDSSSIRYNPFTTHIDVNNLSISKENNNAEKVFAIKKLDLEVRLYHLLFDDLYISEFNIDGLFIDVKQNGKDTYVAGVNISQDTNIEEEHSNEVPEKNSKIPYTLHLPYALINISNINVTVEEKNQYKLDGTTLEFSALELSFSEANELNFKGSSEFLLSKFTALDYTSKDVIAALESLQIQKIDIAVLANKPQVMLENISVDNFNFSQTKLPDTPALFSFNQLLLNQASITDTALDAGDLIMLGVNLDAHINNEKKMVNLIDALQTPPSQDDEVIVNKESEAMIEEDKTVSQSTEEIITQTTKPFVIKLNSFTVQNDVLISFLDESVLPKYERKITLDTFTIGTIDNTKVDVETPIVIKGSSDKYSTINANILIKPFLAVPEYKFDTNINEVDLPAVSSYLIDALGHEITSGQLDLSIKGELKGEHIDSNIGLFLRGIDLAKAEESPDVIEKNIAENKTESSKNAEVEGDDKTNLSVVPFNIALDYLKNDDGNVDLSLPVSGDVNDPSFGLSGLVSIIIKKSVVSAAREYLIATVLPYANVVDIAISAVGDYALEITVKPLEYAYKQIKIDAKQLEFMEQFALLLIEKPDAYVKICAIVTPEDIDKNRTEILNKTDRQTLDSLAKQRASEFKDYMVKEKNVSSSRILFCKPSINQEPETQTQLTFTF